MRTFQIVLLALQSFQVVFLWLHDWVPLGRLNNVAAVRRQDTRLRLVTITLLQSVPWTLGLFWSVRFFGPSYPGWLQQWLWVTYLVLFLGQLRAWWVPYLVSPNPKRAARYRALFGGTHSFLPQRHGMVPNTLHVLLHVSTLATLLMLAAMHIKT